jgi:hypothetical protein
MRKIQLKDAKANPFLCCQRGREWRARNHHAKPEAVVLGFKEWDAPFERKNSIV